MKGCATAQQLMQTIREFIAKDCLDAIPLRGIVVFPNIVTSFEVSRKSSVTAFKNAEKDGGYLFLVAQKDASVLNPTKKDLYSVGVVARIKHSVKLPNGNYQLVVEGTNRAELFEFNEREESYKAVVGVKTVQNIVYDDEPQVEALKYVWTVLGDYLKYAPHPSDEILEAAKKITDLGLLADYLASSFLVKLEDRQQILDEYDPKDRLELFASIIERELDILELDTEIHNRVRIKLQKNQRDAYLREQLRAISSELHGESYGEDDDYDEDDELIEEINKNQLPEAVRDKLLKEAGKLKKMPFGSQEAAVIRNYIEICLELPWETLSKDRLDLVKAEKILNEDHDGLQKVKERILEFMAVKQLSPQLDGQILCLVGPPGVGKTSIVRSVARALNRKYVRISLGGIRDEAEIRGHRKTYVGSMPGRIINGLKLAGTRNPVMLLDELDKLTKDAHGDPTSALLEVLDTEQNKSFRDHFIEMPIDLSEVMFITTANTLETIPDALLDRLEVIQMDSYSASEKISIAVNHLVPKQLKRHGLNKRQLSFTESGIKEIIEFYTKESGVRNLEREIASVCRKVAKKIVDGKIKKMNVDSVAVRSLLGAEKFTPEYIYDKDEQGVVNGLAWTSLGGELLRIEALSMPGNGKIELTGYLGDVMKESARAAISYIRKHSEELEVDPEFATKTDIHIHVPEGAIPKDGPSAGISMACALVSELSGRTVKQSVAMTGELTLTGRVLKIGGLKEKSMAAYKAGVKTVIIPKDNYADIDEFDEKIRSSINFIPVEHFSEVIQNALN